MELEDEGGRRGSSSKTGVSAPVEIEGDKPEFYMVARQRRMKIGKITHEL